MELHANVIINAPAHAAWAVLGERFGYIGEWATPITTSSLEGEPRVGAIRTCHIARFGPVAPGMLKERLIAFDPVAMSFAYEAIEGMPRFIERAVNQWSVYQQDETRCVVRTRATLKLHGPMALLSFLLKRSMRVSGSRVLHELQYQVEHGSPHPRKLAAAAKGARPPSGSSV